jgi:hypothetical protein
LETNADAIFEPNAKMNERRNKNIVVDFMVAPKGKGSWIYFRQ